MTSFVGTIMGAYLVAFCENTLMQLLNHWFGLDFSFKPAIPFIIIILVLLIRPQGFANVNLGFGRSDRPLPRRVPEASTGK
jgi:branched-subunit amino acid ABC-type transport system permease component